VLADASTLDKLRGPEGMASREYFRGIRLVTGDDWGVTARQRHPPPDPVNVMLSFSYPRTANLTDRPHSPP
jgi:CRISP-associated protein Cas1